MPSPVSILTRAAHHASLVIRVCAYCNVVIGALEVAPENAGLSHGACPDCLALVMQRLQGSGEAH